MLVKSQLFDFMTTFHFTRVPGGATVLRGSPLLVFSVSGGGKDGGNLAHGSVRGRMFGRFLQLKLVKKQ